METQLCCEQNKTAAFITTHSAWGVKVKLNSESMLALWSFVMMPCIAFKFEILTLGHLIVGNMFHFGADIVDLLALQYTNAIIKRKEAIGWLQGRSRWAPWWRPGPPLQPRGFAACSLSNGRGGRNVDRCCALFSALLCDCLNDFHQSLYSFLDSINMTGFEGALLGMGNPLLDIISDVDQAFLDKYQVFCCSIM